MSQVPDFSEDMEDTGEPQACPSDDAPQEDYEPLPGDPRQEDPL